LPRVADLSAFGMEAVLSAPVDRPRDMNNRNSTIHLAVVRGNLTPANTNAIIVRFKSANANPMVNAWSEKVLYDEIKARKEWTNQLNFHDRTLNWYHNNTPMRNERGYFMRLFCIYTKGEPPTRPSLLHLGRHICAQLNAIKGNDTVTTLDEATCFWLDPINVVWADVIGFDEALKNLMKETSTPLPYDGFYEAHENTIHTYFHQRSLDIEFADILFAPMRELHPSYELTDRTVQTASSDPPTSADARLLVTHLLRQIKKSLPSLSQRNLPRKSLKYLATLPKVDLTMPAMMVTIASMTMVVTIICDAAVRTIKNALMMMMTRAPTMILMKTKQYHKLMFYQPNYA